MEYLDLTRDDPDEFEGKLINCGGTIYRIGTYLGSGAEKLVYKLVNERSGLCLHVIKFWRDPEIAEPAAEYTVDTEGVLSRGLAQSEFKGIIPNSLIVNGHGGTFQIQDYMGGAFEDETSETYRLWEKANSLLDASSFAEATALYERVLQINPYHSAALNNLGYAQEQLGNLDQSIQLLETLIEIEPNYCPYQQSYIQVAANGGYIRDSLQHFEAMKSRFPYHYSCDALAINLYLMSGCPEKAKELLEHSVIDPSGLYASNKLQNDSVLNPPDRKSLQKEAKAAIMAKKQARSIMARAEQLVQSGNTEGALDLMEKAYSIYEKDPLLVLNLAFALSRANELKRAGNLLISVATIVPPPLAKVCYANTAFNEIRASSLEVVIPLLETTASLVIAENPDQKGIDFSTLPGIAVWIGEQENDENFLVEEPISSASELINHALRQYSQSVPPSVELLAEWYSKAASGMKRL